MKTDIEFLESLRRDLLAAAKRQQRMPQRAVGRTISFPAFRRPTGLRLVAASSAVVIVLAGVVGYVATRPSHSAGSRGEALAKLSRQGATPNGHFFAPSVDVPDAGTGGGAGSGQAPHRAVPAPAPGTQPGGPPSDLSGIRVQSIVGAPTLGPSVIKTASMDIRVPKGTFDDQFQKATAIASKYPGGFVQTSSTSGLKTKSGSLVIRVPVDSFELAIGDLRALGKVDHQSIQGQDVTSQFIDLGARLRNADKEEGVLLKLLAKAPTVQATLSVERQVSQVELLIEELHGQLRVLANRTDFGTVQVNMYEQAPKVQQHHKPSHTTFGSAWHKAVDGFFGVVTSVVTGLGYIVPIAVLLAMAWLVLRRMRRRTRVPA